jgi:hypothetical protein
MTLIGEKNCKKGSFRNIYLVILHQDLWRRFSLHIMNGTAEVAHTQNQDVSLFQKCTSRMIYAQMLLSSERCLIMAVWEHLRAHFGSDRRNLVASHSTCVNIKKVSHSAHQFDRSPPFGTLPKIHIFTQQFDDLLYFSDSSGCASFLTLNT